MESKKIWESNSYQCSKKLLRDDDIMDRGRKEKTDVPKCLEKYSLIKKDISDRNGNMR